MLKRFPLLYSSQSCIGVLQTWGVGCCPLGVFLWDFDRYLGQTKVTGHFPAGSSRLHSPEGQQHRTEGNPSQRTACPRRQSLTGVRRPVLRGRGKLRGGPCTSPEVSLLAGREEPQQSTANHACSHTTRAPCRAHAGGPEPLHTLCWVTTREPQANHHSPRAPSPVRHRSCGQDRVPALLPRLPGSYCPTPAMLLQRAALMLGVTAQIPPPER